MLTDKAVELLMQVPLAGVNIIVVVVFLKYLEKINQQQQDFLIALRQDNNATITNLADNIGELSANVTALKVVTVEHNALMLAAITEMRNAINTRAKARIKTE